MTRWLTDRLLERGRWAWFVPVLTFLVVAVMPERRLWLGIGLVVAVGGMVVLSQRPGSALVFLLVANPFTVLALAAVYRLGLPAGMVRQLGLWKEVVLGGVALAAVRSYVRVPRPLDRVDRRAVAFLLVVTAYLLVPFVLTPGSPASLHVRLVVYRENVSFIVLFLAARHAPIAVDAARRLGRGLLVAGGVVASVGIFEVVFSDAWNRFLVFVAQVGYYRVTVLHVLVPNPSDLRVYGLLGDVEIVRPGSVFINPLALGTYLTVVVALALATSARHHGKAWVTVVLSASAAMLMLTLTRSAVLSGLVAALVVVRQGMGGNRQARARAAIVLAVGTILLVPVAATSGLVDRSVSAVSGDEASADAHARALGEGLQALASHPLGVGLGSQPGFEERFGVQGVVTAENAYIQVGNELGIPALVLFVALLVGVIRALRGLAWLDEELPFPLVTATRAAAIGVAIGGFFLHVWLVYAAALAIWGSAGLVLGLADRTPRRPHPGEIVARPPSPMLHQPH